MTTSTDKEQTASEVRKNLVMAFATPIMSIPWPDSETLNATLRSYILDVEQKNPGITRSNVGGWHSQAGIFDWDADCIRALQARVRAAAVEMTRSIITQPDVRFSANYHLDGWANVLRSGDYHSVHNHPASLWSGVYYVAVGDLEPGRPNNGQLELLDPRAGRNIYHLPNSVMDLRYTVMAKAGDMVVFPSWLNHFVHPFVGSGERISVSFNVVLSDFRFVEDDKNDDRKSG